MEGTNIRKEGGSIRTEGGSIWTEGSMLLWGRTKSLLFSLRIHVMSVYERMCNSQPSEHAS